MCRNFQQWPIKKIYKNNFHPRVNRASWRHHRGTSTKKSRLRHRQAYSCCVVRYSTCFRQDALWPILPSSTPWNLQLTLSQQEVEKFLKAIREIATQLSRHDASRNRKDVHLAIQSSVAKQLKMLPPSDQSWLSELKELNHSDDDDVDFITALLTEYFVDRPWVLHRRLIAQMIDYTRWDPIRLVRSLGYHKLLPMSQHPIKCAFHSL